MHGTDPRVRAGALRRARTRAAILDALERQLRVRALDEVSVADLAADANVSVGSIYGHFDCKARVALVLALDRVAPELERMPTGRAADEPLERALALGDLLARVADRTPAAVYLVAHPREAYEELIASGDPASRAARRMVALLEQFEDDLAAAEARGLLAEGDTAASLGAGLKAVWLGLLWAATPGWAVAPLRGPVADVWSALRRALMSNAVAQ